MKPDVSSIFAAVRADPSSFPIAYRVLCDEIERLKAGHFTPEEFQNLCHHLDETKRAAFYQGCADYQRKLFKVSDRDLLQNTILKQREEIEHLRRLDQAF